MDKFVLHIFQREVERQCRFALMAIDDLNKALQTKQTNDMDRIWYSIQGVLVAAGNISKLLWSSPRHLPDRGTELRASLSVGIDSPLKPRTFRNHFEHFDERLEKWATSSVHHNFVDSNVVPQGMIAGSEPSDFFRNFDPTNLTVTFGEDRYHLQPIADAVRDLRQKAEEAVRKGVA